MATSIQIKRGVTAKVAAYTPLSGELVLDTTTNKLYAGDGSTAGGKQVVASKVGVTDASTAPATEVGETMSVTGSAVTLTTQTTASLCSLTLTPGDWEIESIFYVNPTAGATAITAGNNSATTAIDAVPFRFQMSTAFSAIVQCITAPRRRYNISANQTIYLNVNVTFSSGSCTGNGYMFARRIR
ncbi:hypothetical protein [Erwinia phyllosphaerae]|uniref:hyaluronate lyase N-terminal domain-containing protein n=1 Tax=Erwinia phyllosphaerae TaxID=2853256 RepID=UPI001FEE4136|nr:hypothetical protein [Erwinia phyllosphaerae]MBV4365929.1 hypothetical protein [Erwinia phyllosphaerae]